MEMVSVISPYGDHLLVIGTFGIGRAILPPGGGTPKISLYLETMMEMERPSMQYYVPPTASGTSRM